jgi:hypothetical protein
MNTSFEIVPGERVGEFKLGMTRGDVARVLGFEPPRIRLTPFSKTEVDNLRDVGLFLEYDEKDHLIAVDVRSPVGAAWDGFDLMHSSLETTLAMLRKRGYDVEDLAGSYLVDEVGVAVYAPLGRTEGVRVYSASARASE